MCNNLTDGVISEEKFKQKFYKLVDNCEMNFNLNDEKIGLFFKYTNQLLEWNKKINLTAITDVDDIIIKHFIDSLSVLNACEVPKNSKLIDIGTGAGFPGMPIKICRPDLTVTLLDSVKKKITFLQNLNLYLNNIEVDLINSRAELISRDKNYREKFDFITSRAVAPLNILVEYCTPFLKKGGIFVAMKGNKVYEELSCSNNAINLLGCQVIEVKSFNLPKNNYRAVVVIQKIENTKIEYPRTSSKITKKPL